MQPGMSLGLLINARRQEIGITLAELGRRVGLNRSTILRLEQGRTSQPGPDTLTKLASVLQLPAAELFRLAGHRLPNTLPGLRDYLLATYGQLPEQVIQSIEQQIETGCRLRDNTEL